MMKSNLDIPVLMYHSIGVPDKSWNWNYLTCPYDRFEQQLIAIKESGMITISLPELYDYMVLGKSIPENSIVLTFDDGYADIWIYAYPLLKKYNMCGTVFINPEFVDPRQGYSELYKHDHKTDHLPQNGFLNWNEIITMDKEGIIFSESHALTHTWYPISDKIIDFRHPRDNYTWMTWNDNILLKYRLQKDDKTLARLGQPVYENGKSLMYRKYYNDIGLDQFLIDFVNKNGGTAFFKNLNYREILHSQVKVYKEKFKSNVRYESQEEFESRIRYELSFTKTVLEDKLKREITFLCWPGGSATNIGMKIAQEVGYKFFNSARDMSKAERKALKNIRNGGIRIKRFTPLIYFNMQENFNSKIVYADNSWMKLYLFRKKGSLISKILFKSRSKLAEFKYS